MGKFFDTVDTFYVVTIKKIPKGDDVTISSRNSYHDAKTYTIAAYIEPCQG